MSAQIQQLDDGVFRAVQIVADRLLEACARSSSLDERRLMMTRAHVLLAMTGTHRSIRRLLAVESGGLDLSVDAFPLTRMQLERCFLTLLLEDKPGRWHKRYQKNAWKSFAKKYFRDQCSLGHLSPFDEYFGPNGTGISMLRAMAREMYVWEDELQTLRIQIVGDHMDPRWEMRYIADMPTPAKAIGLLENPTHKDLAKLLYPYYDSLSHFTHGGMAGVMEAALLRRGEGESEALKVTRERFWRTNIIEATLPTSYVAQLTVATLMALPFTGEGNLREMLAGTWQPYHSDGSPLGVTIWDAWAGEALGQTRRAD